MPAALSQIPAANRHTHNVGSEPIICCSFRFISNIRNSFGAVNKNKIESSSRYGQTGEPTSLRFGVEFLYPSQIPDINLIDVIRDHCFPLARIGNVIARTKIDFFVYIRIAHFTS